MNDTDAIPAAFREHFARHNKQALVLVILTLFAAVLMWTAVYIFLYWFILFALTAVKGGDAAIPKSYLPVFGGCALTLCLIGWIVRKLRPSFFPSDHKSPFEIFSDIVLVLPRVTMEIWGNLSALRFLNEYELETAWHLLLAAGENGRLSVYSLPIEIPNAALRDRVVFALQLVGLVELRKYSDGLWLVPYGEFARKLLRPRIRIKAPAAGADYPGF